MKTYFQFKIGHRGIETCIISYKKQIAVQVRCRIQDAWGWCTGMTQRDGTGREVGEGFRMGNVYTHGRFMLMYGKTNTIL